MSLFPAVHTASFDRGDKHRGLEPHPPQQVAESVQLDSVEPVRDFQEARTGLDGWFVGGGRNTLDDFYVLMPAALMCRGSL